MSDRDPVASEGAVTHNAATIRPLTSDDYSAWLPLWQQYMGFHGVWPEDVPLAAWPRFLDPGEPMYAIGAFVNERLVGFAHYVFHRHTWTEANCCFLADVFTVPDARRSGVAKTLVESVFARAAERGADHVYGTTLLSNELSHRLYDQVAERMNVLFYRHQL